MFCKNCGKELPEGSKFCGDCGTPVVEDEAPVAAPAYAETPVEGPAAAAPAYAETPVEVPAAAAVAGAETAVADVPGKRRGKSGLIVLGAIGIVAVILLVVLIKLIGGLFGGGSDRAQAFAYLNGDNELMYLANLKEKTEAQEVSDEAGSSDVVFSKNGKTLYYRDANGTLYQIAVAELKKSGRPERIARNVSSFRLLDNGNILYMKSGELNVYTGKDDYRLVKSCDSYRLYDDESTVYYREQEDDGTYALYKIALKKDAEEEELLDGATSIYTTWNADLLVYSERDSTDGTLAVYSCKPGGEATKLLKNAYRVYGVNVDGSKVSFYYALQETNEHVLYDFVTDSKLNQDNTTTAQELTRPSWYDEYYPQDILFENGVWNYTDPKGDSFVVDVSSLLNDDTPIADLYIWRVRDLAENAAREKYNAARDEYNAKIDEYNAAKNRNEMREALKNEKYTLTSYDLYHYTGSDKSDPVASGVNLDTVNGAYYQGVFLYKKLSNNGDVEPVVDIADLYSYYNVYDYLNAGNVDNDWYQLVGDTESAMDFDDDETYLNGTYSLGDKELVLDLSEGGERSLVSYNIGKTELTFSSTILDAPFNNLTFDVTPSGDPALYFFTDVEYQNYGASGDFNRYSNGKTDVLAKEAFGVIFLDDSDKVYVLSDMGSNGYELSKLDNGKTTAILDDVSRVPVFLNAKEMLYLSDGDLYLFNGKDDRRIARDVKQVWANSYLGYSAYYPNY